MIGAGLVIAGVLIAISLMVAGETIGSAIRDFTFQWRSRR